MIFFSTVHETLEDDKMNWSSLAQYDEVYDLVSSSFYALEFSCLL